MVDSAHPPGAQAWKGTAVRSLRSYVSWVNEPNGHLSPKAETILEVYTLQLGA
jgi:hypothetical protein